MHSYQKDNTDVCSIVRIPLRFWMVVYRRATGTEVVVIAHYNPLWSGPSGLTTERWHIQQSAQWCISLYLLLLLLLPITTRFGRDTTSLPASLWLYNWAHIQQCAQWCLLWLYLSVVFVTSYSLVFVYCYCPLHWKGRSLVGSLWSYTWALVQFSWFSNIRSWIPNAH